MPLTDENAGPETPIEGRVTAPQLTTTTETKSVSVAPVILTIGGLLFTLGMLVGAFGPWVKVLAVTVAGTDGSNGWLAHRRGGGDRSWVSPRVWALSQG
jgi:hypothetical protein